MRVKWRSEERVQGGPGFLQRTWGSCRPTHIYEPGVIGPTANYSIRLVRFAKFRRWLNVKVGLYDFVSNGPSKRVQAAI